MAQMTMHHFRTPKWISDAVREVAEGTERSDSEVIRAALRDYLGKFGITEDEYLTRNYASNQ